MHQEFTKLGRVDAKPKKILIIRLSSIGDIVLTTPVIRMIHEALPGTEIHYLTKQQYAPLLSHHPLITRLHLFEGNLQRTAALLKAERFDLVLDLHNNQRTGLLQFMLGSRWLRFHKLNFRKLLLTVMGWNTLPSLHIVERYAAPLKKIGIDSKPGPLELHLWDGAAAYAQEQLSRFPYSHPVGIVLGATFETKKWPVGYFPRLLELINEPVVLFGGKTEQEDAAWLMSKTDMPVLDLTGKCTLQESAAVLRECKYVITNDNGLMHFAAAFRLKTYSIWGNTVPEFGMWPWMTEHAILENEKLKCRPCSKLGYDRCPKGHFRCMREILPEKVAKAIRGE